MVLHLHHSLGLLIRISYLIWVVQVVSGEEDVMKALQQAEQQAEQQRAAEQQQQQGSQQQPQPPNGSRPGS